MMPNLNVSSGLSYVQLKIEPEKVHLFKRDVFWGESTCSFDWLVLWSCYVMILCFCILGFIQLCLELFL